MGFNQRLSGCRVTPTELFFHFHFKGEGIRTLLRGVGMGQETSLAEYPAAQEGVT